MTAADPPVPRSESRLGSAPTVWPLLGLRVVTPRLELRLPSGEEVLELFSRVPDDYEVDPSWPPFGFADRPTQTAHLQQFWRALGNWRPSAWRLPLAVWREGRAVGVQELEAENFAVLRTVESSSFLVPQARDEGIGKEMRRAVLSLAFDHLGAEFARSGAWHDNAASLGVSRAVGYRDNGWHLQVRDGRADVQRDVILEKKDWVGASDVEVHGLDACMAWFGA